MTATYFLNCIMGNVFNSKTEPTLPTEYYLGLSTSAPELDGENVSEPEGKGYQRVKLESLSEPENGVIKNNADIQFEESTDSWGTITHFVIYDQQTSGNLLMYAELLQERNVETATIVTVKTGNLKITLANPTE